MALILETSRLQLRRFRGEDLPAFRSLYQDSAVMRFIGDGKPWSVAEIDVDFEAVLARTPVAPLLGRVAVVPRGQSPVIGWGLIDQWEGTSLVELGFGLLPSFQGRGLGRELATALVAWVRAAKARFPLVATVHHENIASARLLETLGFVRVGIALRDGRSKDFYALDEPDLTEAKTRGLVELTQ